ncbi:hypothetical protein HNV12_03220 [Methanococcoides sp. SA1]|nr:hypothetical protein [Methanococcoides sp. SA1]
MFVKSVMPRVVLNSRKERTIEVVLETYEGKFSCSAPSGKSTGKSEVSCYHEKGIGYSMRMLHEFCKGLVHENFIIKSVGDIKILNERMLKFEKKFGAMGGNVWYALEGAFLRAAAADNQKELWEFINDDLNDGLKPKMPMPVGNCIGGGLHSKKVKGMRPDFQEFLLIPNEKSYGKAVTKNFRAYNYAKRVIAGVRGFGGSGVRGRAKRNDEGAWNVGLSNENALEVLRKVADRYDLRIGLDVASGSFFDKGYYMYENKELIRDKVDQADYMERIVKRFGIFYLEDAMDEDDFGGFREVLGNVKKCLVVGDDLTTTHLKRVHRAVRGKAMNAMIIKPNQVGSILEVKKVVEYCKTKGIVMIFSHRSGETMDDILADYCVGFGGQFMKSGIFGRERLVKAKRVMEIERSLGGLR